MREAVPRPPLTGSWKRAYDTARRTLDRVGPQATADDVFRAVARPGSFVGGFVEDFSEARQWEATHVPLQIPAALTQIIMTRKPYDPQPALVAVSAAQVGALTSDRAALTPSQWRRVEQYQALATFGFGQAVALKLATFNNGIRRRHQLLALFRAPDAPPVGPEERTFLEALHIPVRAALQRIAVPLLSGRLMLDQVLREQGQGLVVLRENGAIQEADSRAYELALKYAPVLGVNETRDVLPVFVERLLRYPENLTDGRRHLRKGPMHHLVITEHDFDPEVHDLPGRRTLLAFLEEDARSESNAILKALSILPPARQKIAELLIGTGLLHKEIAATLELSEGTVRTQVTHIHRAFGVHSRAELAAIVRRSGDVAPPSSGAAAPGRPRRRPPGGR